VPSEAASPSPAAPEPQSDHEGSPLVRNQNRRLARDLAEAEQRIARLLSEHAKEVAYLRAELEANTQDRQQLARLVEDAKNEQLAAEESVTLHEQEARQVQVLNARLQQEAEATTRVRRELEAAQQRIAEAEKRAAREGKRASTASEEITSLKLQLTSMAELRESEQQAHEAALQETKAAAVQAEEVASELEHELEALRSQQANFEASRAAPSVPHLNLYQGRLSATNASPDGRPPDTPGQSFGRGYVTLNDARTPRNAVGCEPNNAQGAQGGRSWARRREASQSVEPTPRHSEVYRPGGDNSPTEFTLLINDSQPSDLSPPNSGGEMRRKKKCCPCCVVA
jgi:chemotaxis protein histidine kinase CheA